MEARITYFESKGKANTAEVLRLARQRAEQLGIGYVVLASTHGATALQAARVFQGTKVRLTAVSISPSFEDTGWAMSVEERTRVEAAGIRVLTGLHALADGVSEGMWAPTEGGATTGGIVAHTLRMFSQGMKVAVEVSLMALEAGMVPPGAEIIAIGGTDEGADTAIVARPAFARKIKDYHICEVLCKPRLG